MISVSFPAPAELMLIVLYRVKVMKIIVYFPAADGIWGFLFVRGE